ncbi:conserved hypothetical protein [Methanococcus vannielii SB]|uniref:DNA repair protein n=1 Tax=Methanococcus vannielii (strain ATCC 35089 / DSM 1224 / JCM 13029 / OCM 148 / SB) TaxID=406327 RepID=A6UNF4_METVS|nr:CRISPR-associated endonuclease Cas6 [Methanococcus vannielii]ABR54026.1 conserved hypothetical protein [Methanococcus vannielii SB]
MAVLDYLIIKYPDLRLKMSDSQKVRGYFANKYSSELMFHNHENKSFLYGYPKIQYKVIDKIPHLVGISEGAILLKETAVNEDSIDVDGKTYISKIEVINEKAEFGISKMNTYEFKVPWMPINQENFKKYADSDNFEKEELLKRILAGNILSMAKGFEHTVSERILSDLNLDEITVKFKNKNMVGFKGTFECNFSIPNYLGLGKSVSRGFGTVKKVN